MKRIVSIILAAVLIISLSSCSSGLNHTANQADSAAQTGFAIHYIDVGQADAALVLCDDAAMLIDGGNAQDSDLIYTYLQNQKISYLDYIICTHAHEDHVGGLSAPLATLAVGAVYAPQTGADTKAYQNFVKKAEEQRLEIQHPKPGNSLMLGSSHVDFFGPITENTDNLNNTSIVLKITYGSTAFLFTGDAEREEEADIVNAGYDLSANVLKVGHHGSDSSTSYPFLREVMPQYAIICAGAGNSYGHPTEEVLSRLHDADATVYRTDLQGDILVTSDGETVSVQTQKNTYTQTSAAPANQPAADGEYIGNKKSMKFHLPSCRSLPAEQNRVSIPTREQAIADGFSPCGICNP